MGVWSIGLLTKCGMTQEELNLLSKGMSANYCKFNLDAGIQKCPGCQCWCARTDKTKDGVRCDQCYRKKGKPYDTMTSVGFELCTLNCTSLQNTIRFTFFMMGVKLTCPYGTSKLHVYLCDKK